MDSIDVPLIMLGQSGMPGLDELVFVNCVLSC